jgi:hypothetical protein
VVPIAQVGSTRVEHHHVLRIAMSDGSVLNISPGHPLANGRPLSSLSAGDEVDEQHSVQAIELVPYAYDHTYDILPSSSTGTYFAAGALLGSTLWSSAMKTSGLDRSAFGPRGQPNGFCCVHIHERDADSHDQVGPR